MTKRGYGMEKTAPRRRVPLLQLIIGLRGTLARVAQNCPAERPPYHQALPWMWDHTNHEEGGQRKRPRSVRGQLAAPVDKAGGFEARRLRGFRRRNPRRSPAAEIAYVTITSPVQLAMPTGSPPFWCTSYLQSRAAPRKRKMHLPDRRDLFCAREPRGRLAKRRPADPRRQRRFASAMPAATKAAAPRRRSVMTSPTMSQLWITPKIGVVR